MLCYATRWCSAISAAYILVQHHGPKTTHFSKKHVLFWCGSGVLTLVLGVFAFVAACVFAIMPGERDPWHLTLQLGEASDTGNAHCAF